MKRYLLITARTPNFNRDHLEGHYEHLQRLQAENRLELYGPFSDTTGGAYLVKAESLEEATAIAHADPLVKNGSATIIIKEWLTK